MDEIITGTPWNADAMEEGIETLLYSTFSTRCELNPIFFSLTKCYAANDRKIIFFFFSWELCAPKFMEFSVAIRGNPDIKCLAFHTRTLCRTVSKAVTNNTEVSTSAWSPRTVILGKTVSRLDHIVANHWLLVCPQSFTGLEPGTSRKVSAFDPWTGWTVGPQQKYFLPGGLEWKNSGVIHSSAVW